MDRTHASQRAPRARARLSNSIPRQPRVAGLLALCALLVAACAGVAAAQTTDTATLRGRVVDQAGAAVSGATVVAVNEATGQRREARTDESGRYTLAGLPLTGGYKLTFSGAGFAETSAGPVALRAGEAASVDVTLTPRLEESSVEVFGTVGGVRSDSPQLGTRLDAAKIEETPTYGRKVTSLVFTNSAVRPARGTGDLFINQFLFVVNGSGRRQTTFQLDGSTADDAWGRQTIFTAVPLAALQEFTVLTNTASAEYGRTTGSAVNLVTRTGTNDLHGEVLVLNRPEFWQARQPVSQFPTPDRLTQVSTVVTGPVARDRTFFTAGVEVSSQRRDTPITTSFAPGVFKGRFSQALFVGRLDHRLNANNTLTGRANLDVFTDTNPSDAVGGNNLPTAARTFRRSTYMAQLSETAIISPSVINQARFQFQLGSPITQFRPAQPSTQFVRPGLATEGESRAATLINHQYQLADTLSLVRGAHNLRVGGDAIFSSSGGNGQEFGAGFTLGQFTLQPGVRTPVSQLTAADLNSRVVQRFTQSFGSASYNVREWLWAGFAQDDWRARRDLTLNLGLRYERQTFTDDTNNFAPRVGFAYNPGGDARTVIRAGYGIYYSEIRANAGAQYAISGPTGLFTFSAVPGATGFPTSFSPLTSLPPGAPVPARDIIIRPGRAAYYSQFFDVSRLRGYPARLLNPYTQQATAGFERELLKNWVFSADYVHARTLKIDRNLDLNAPAPFARTLPGQTRSAAAADATRPITPVNGGYRRIQSTVNNGASTYDGLQLNLNRRFADNFQLLASYTLSHTRNNVEPDAPGGDPNDFHLQSLEWADSLLDQRHRAALSGYWRMPFRFTLGGLTTLASGRPYNFTTGVDNNGDAANTDRPVVNGAVVGRNAGRTAPAYETDLFIERDLRLTEGVRLSLRAEGFNLFNHPNIVSRNGVYGNAATGVPLATFGTTVGGISNVDPGRQFQFLGRLRF
jgi:hypothetical protein